METPLLQTKLHIPPVRPAPSVVSRPRLIEQLNEGTACPLTLISAPAGFGKTTLVTDWLRQQEIPVAWLSLDEGDNDCTRFLTYFVAALQTIETNLGKGALSALQATPSQPPVEAVLISLLNEIAALSDRIILVLDDYHLIESQPIHETLTFLLERLPPQMGLVISTRDDPHLPLARLRVRGQLTELRATDLRFTASEAAEFLTGVMGLDLSTEEITALESRTEGWIAGLQLAAISMQGREDTAGFVSSFSGSHRFVLDYLVEEVLDRQSESVQAFLLQTALLDRLTGSLCDAITGQDNGQATLEYLEHANLFIIPLDQERRWYRYHHLFADLLRQRLRQRQPDLVSMLHLRASEWYEQNGFADEAIACALRVEDFERAVSLIQGVAETVWVGGGHDKLRHWLDRLPPALLFSHPHLCIFHAWSLFAAGQPEAAERSAQAAEQALAAGAKQERLNLRGRVAVVRAFMAFFRGDVPGIIQHARQALEYLPEQDVTWRSTATAVLGDAYIIKGEMAAAYWVQLEALEASRATGNIYVILIANLKLAITLGQRGRLRRTIEICRQQLQLAGESGLSQTVVVGWLLAIWGEVLAEINDLDGAVYQAKRGVELTTRGVDTGDVAMLGWSYLCLTRVLFSRGDLTGAEEIIREMENIARESDVPPWITNLIAAWQARIWLAQNKLEAVSQWMQERGLDAGREPTLLHEMEYSIILARLCLAQGRLDEATGLLSRLFEAAQAGGRTTRMIEILLLQSLAWQLQEEPDEALIPLEKALTLAEPGGYIRIFVDEGPPMARLLYEAATRGIAPDYTPRLLAAFSVTEPEQTDPPPSELVEPLSERELEVLQLIAEGLTNREVASRLYLSLNTVKVHTRNIYGKLGVNSRTQAAVQARDLGILPPSNRSDAEEGP